MNPNHTTPEQMLKLLRVKPTPERIKLLEAYRTEQLRFVTGQAGSAKTEAKANASRANGAKGGRPRKQPTQEQP